MRRKARKEMKQLQATLNYMGVDATYEKGECRGKHFVGYMGMRGVKGKETVFPAISFNPDPKRSPQTQWLNDGDIHYHDHHAARSLKGEDRSFSAGIRAIQLAHLPKGAKTIRFSELAKLSFSNSKDCPPLVRFGFAKAREWMGIGWVELEAREVPVKKLAKAPFVVEG